ncbi:hypothetical protein BGX29_002667 [Mortierella sp. GBA35]|nr:hypothetical protein BGX29_002667 [Mortierella sp. GBA35]
MSSKASNLIGLTFAMFLVIMSTDTQNQAEAMSFPICSKTPIMDANWDSDSYGIDAQHKYERFVRQCMNAKDSKHQWNYWN